MKKYKKIVIILVAIMSFIGAFIGSAQARTYHFLGTVDGLMNSPVQAPFDSGATYTTNVAISSISSMTVANIDQKTVDITLTTNNGTDLDTVDLS